MAWRSKKLAKQALSNAADCLARTRWMNVPSPTWPRSCAPESIEDGYTIQNEFVASFDTWKIGGWKAACTSKDQQDFLKVSEPFTAPLFQHVIFHTTAPYPDPPSIPSMFGSSSNTSHSSPHFTKLINLPSSPETQAIYPLPSSYFFQTGLESEFAFTMKQNLPKRGEDHSSIYTQDEVMQAISTIHPAVEIISPRIESAIKFAHAPSVLADCGINGGLVVGKPLNWDNNMYKQLPNTSVRLYMNGKFIRGGKGSEVLGNPIHSLTWIANNIAKRYNGLKIGDVITTGTCTSLNWAKQGNEIRAEFGDFGIVHFKLVPV